MINLWRPQMEAMLVHPFVAQFPTAGSYPATTNFFQRVKADFPRFRQEGIYQQVEQPAMYVYEIQRLHGQPMRGLLAGVPVREYLEERVRKHENTLMAKEETQMELLQSRQASVKPVLLAHRPHQGLTDLLQSYCARSEPSQEIRIEDTGEVHRLWQIRETEELTLIQRF
ncbi:MAG: DUF1015 family protein, partial [Bacteroidetes bacterium]